MAEKNLQISHSIQSLLYVEWNGNYCGYKLELISDNISGDLRDFIICSECKGVCREARQWKGKTVCGMCVSGTAGNLDEKVGNKIAILNSKCPLSENGCDWAGVLAEMERHMFVCPKFLIECKQKCGTMVESENYEQHSREICPFRLIECQFCKKEIQIKEENQHMSECTVDPDTEIPCPYKELGCDVLILRKNNDIHQTENLIGHQNLMLDQLNQLREKNKQLEQLIIQQKDKYHQQEAVSCHQKNLNEQQETLNDQQRERNQQQERFNNEYKTRMKSIETSTTEREKEHKVEKILIMVVCILIGLLAIGIAIAVRLPNTDQYYREQIVLMKESMGYIEEYIEERGKIISGIEWIHGLQEKGFIYGPSFYLGQCKLRLKARLIERNAEYFIERSKGQYDTVMNSCSITYLYATYGYPDDTKPEYTSSSYKETNLDVGGIIFLSAKYWRFSERKIRVRVYFDTKDD